MRLSYAIFTLLAPGVAACAPVQPCITPNAARSPFVVSEPTRERLRRSEVLTRQRAYTDAIEVLRTHTPSPRDGACVAAEIQGQLGDLHATIFDTDAALTAYRRHLDAMGGPDSAYGHGPDGQAVVERMRLLSNAVQQHQRARPPETYGQRPEQRPAPPANDPLRGPSACDPTCARRRLTAWSARLEGTVFDIEGDVTHGALMRFLAVASAGRSVALPAAVTAPRSGVAQPAWREMGTTLAALFGPDDFSSTTTADGVRVEWSVDGQRAAQIDTLHDALYRPRPDGRCPADDLLRVGLSHIDLSTRIDPQTTRIPLDSCSAMSGSTSKDVSR